MIFNKKPLGFKKILTVTNVAKVSGENFPIDTYTGRCIRDMVMIMERLNLKLEPNQSHSYRDTPVWALWKQESVTENTNILLKQTDICTLLTAMVISFPKKHIMDSCTRTHRKYSTCAKNSGDVIDTCNLNLSLVKITHSLNIARY